MTNRKIDLYPSVFSFQSLDLGSEIKKFDFLTSALHLDMIDGIYIKNFGLPFYIIRMIKMHTNKPIHIHTMMFLDNFIDEIIALSPTIVFFHFDSIINLDRMNDKCNKCGITMCPVVSDYEETKIAKTRFQFDTVLFMTVKPGLPRQKFIKSKILELQKIHSHFPELNIIVDGGINASNLQIIMEYIGGAVVGSCLYKDDLSFLRGISKPF
ncbi:MAG: hypothetical protein H6845_02670 [Alphaproteobacteria bacterium]|nr:MAG: hypothetical protein H6845_02670 [Alphaproteobacteria bacterium]